MRTQSLLCDSFRSSQVQASDSGATIVAMGIPKEEKVRV